MVCTGMAISNTSREQLGCNALSTSHLKSLQEVCLPNAFPSGIASTLGNLSPLLETFRDLGQRVNITVFTLVVLRRCNIGCLVMRWNLRRESRSTSGPFLLIAFPLLLVQVWSQKTQSANETLMHAGESELWGNIRLKSIPLEVALGWCFVSANKVHSQSGYSESSRAYMSGLFL